MGVSLFCRLSEAHPQAISALQSQVIIHFTIQCIFLVVFPLILTKLYVSSTACVKALWNYQMP